MKHVVLLLVLYFCALNTVQADTFLVRDGQARSLIVTATRPSPAAARGAQWMAEVFRRATGCELSIVRESALRNVQFAQRHVTVGNAGDAIESLILVGDSDLAARLGVTSAGLERGGCRLRTAGNTMVLLGADTQTPQDPNGSLYAVSIFLEQQLGVRYLWPGELGLIVPARSSIALPALDEQHTPRITQRRIRWSSRGDRTDTGLAYLGLTPDDRDRLFAAAIGKDQNLPDWNTWHRVGGSLGLNAGHSFGFAWKAFHTEHPDWFAMQPNGSRDLSTLSPDRARLCKSNLDLIDALARYKIAQIRQSGARSVSLAPNDGGRSTFCTCPECTRLDPPDARPVTLTDYTQSPPRVFEHVALTDRMVWFWNRLAERIKKECPDVSFVTYAYSVYKAPPTRERLRPDIAVGFVGVVYDNEATRQQALADWADWSKMASQLYWRPNLLPYGRRNGAPGVFIHKLADDLRQFANSGLVGTDFDSIVHHWATEGLNYYVLARLLWDPDQDVDELLDDYCRAGFGPAAEPVKRFFLRIEQHTDQTAATGGSKLAPYTAEACAELQRLLDSAAALAGDDELIRRRIEFLRAGIVFAEIQARTHTHAERHRDSKATPKQMAQFKADMETKFQLMRRLFREHPLALNMATIAWGSEGIFRRHGWHGAKTLPNDRWDADEDGNVIPPER